MKKFARRPVGAASSTPRDRRNRSYISEYQRQRRRSRDDTIFNAPCKVPSNVWNALQQPPTVRGARRKSRNHSVSGGVFLHTFCRCWQKVCRRRPLPRSTGRRGRRPLRRLEGAFRLNAAGHTGSALQISTESHAITRKKRPRFSPGTFPHLYKYYFSPRWRLSWRMSVPMNGRIVYSPSMRE